MAKDKLNTTVQYNEEGVRWLDEYLNRLRQHASEEVKDKLPNTLGAFLGECIHQTFGGSWIQDPEFGWAIKINDKLSVYPFNKVAKQLRNEDGESVLGLFTAIPPLLSGIPLSHSSNPVAQRNERPWWKFW